MRWGRPWRRRGLAVGCAAEAARTRGGSDRWRRRPSAVAAAPARGQVWRRLLQLEVWACGSGCCRRGGSGLRGLGLGGVERSHLYVGLMGYIFSLLGWLNTAGPNTGFETGYYRENTGSRLNGRKMSQPF